MQVFRDHLRKFRLYRGKKSGSHHQHRQTRRKHDEFRNSPDDVTRLFALCKFGRIPKSTAFISVTTNRLTQGPSPKSGLIRASVRSRLGRGSTTMQVSCPCRTISAKSWTGSPQSPLPDDHHWPDTGRDLERIDGLSNDLLVQPIEPNRDDAPGGAIAVGGPRKHALAIVSRRGEIDRNTVSERYDLTKVRFMRHKTTSKISARIVSLVRGNTDGGEGWPRDLVLG